MDGNGMHFSKIMFFFVRGAYVPHAPQAPRAHIVGVSVLLAGIRNIPNKSLVAEVHFEVKKVTSTTVQWSRKPVFTSKCDTPATRM